MTHDTLEAVRSAYADELRHARCVRYDAVTNALASVSREAFCGPSPWRVLSPIRSPDYWTTEDADPRHLYHDILVAIDESRRLNNGQPSLWAATLRLSR